MWDRHAKDRSAARDFAQQHGLGFYGPDAPALPTQTYPHPFSDARRDDCVAGQWRGRTVQRFGFDGMTVELLALPRPLPRIQVVPIGMDRSRVDIGGIRLATGDRSFDARYTTYSDDEPFARALLNAAMREALMHPAAEGRGLTIDGDLMYLWTPAPGTWDDARIRFEFLAVLISRISLDVWERFDRTARAVPVSRFAPVTGATPAVAEFQPEPEPADEDRWMFDTVEVPEPQQPAARTEAVQFAVDATFMPEARVEGEEYNMFRVAPLT